MNKVNKFYLKQAIYQVEIDETEVALLLDYGGNKYEILGGYSPKVDEIAKTLLNKKHGVNFAYKFNGKIEENNL